MSDRERHLARSFGEVGATYAAVRPGYPGAALDWALPAHATQVLDLAAGTGKLTQQLVARGLDVVAVEPSDGMLCELRRAVPDARVLAGWAEAIPVPDASVDAITVGQAWHWFDPGTAARECARVLRPDGVVVLLWNRFDPSVPWAATLDRVSHMGPRHASATTPPRGAHRPVSPAPQAEQDDDPPALEAPLEPGEHRRFRWRRRLDLDQLLELVSTFSVVSTMAPTDRATVLAAVRDVVDTEPGVPDPLELPYETVVVRSRLRR